MIISEEAFCNYSVVISPERIRQWDRGDHSMNGYERAGNPTLQINPINANLRAPPSRTAQPQWAFGRGKAGLLRGSQAGRDQLQPMIRPRTGVPARPPDRISGAVPGFGFFPDI